MHGVRCWLCGSPRPMPRPQNAYSFCKARDSASQNVRRLLTDMLISYHRERDLKHGAAFPVVGTDRTLVHVDDLLGQGTCLKDLSSDARPYYSKCFRVLRENPFSTVENGLLQKQPIKVHVSASIYYLLFSLLFSSAKSAWPSAIPIIEAIVPIKKKLSVCKSTRLKIKLSLMP